MSANSSAVSVGRKEVVPRGAILEYPLLDGLLSKILGEEGIPRRYCSLAMYSCVGKRELLTPVAVEEAKLCYIEVLVAFNESLR